MAFPLSTIFQGLKGLVHITITADAAGNPEIIHFADEAGQACAHFALHEWDLIAQHIGALLHQELAAPPTVEETKHESFGGTLTDPPAPITPTQPFLAPETGAAGTAETPQDAQDPA